MKNRPELKQKLQAKFWKAVILNAYQNSFALKCVFQVPVTYQSVKLSLEREFGEFLSLSSV